MLGFQSACKDDASYVFLSGWDIFCYKMCFQIIPAINLLVLAF